MSPPDMAPEIIVGTNEHRRVTVLALTAEGHRAEDNDFLFWELDRARLVPDGELPADVVRLNSHVQYEDETGTHVARLVAPSESGAPAALSILTPEGTALFGLRAGQEIAWRDGQHQRRWLRVVAARNGVDGGKMSPPPAQTEG